MTKNINIIFFSTLVVDHQEFLEHNQDLDLVYRICKDVANVMNALYSPLNIYIALVGVVVWTEYDEITLSTDGDTTLKNFLNYRKERLVKEHPNDNAQLLTGIQFEGGVVGKSNWQSRINEKSRINLTLKIGIFPQKQPAPGAWQHLEK